MSDLLKGELKITFKCPDAVSEAIEEFLEQQKCPDGVDEEEWEAIKDHRLDKIRERCYKWFRYGEYVDLRLDLENDTCVVLKAKP